MRVRFWGVRGSISVPGKTTLKVGGNTSCIEIMNNQKELLIIDAGTGIYPLGQYILKNYLEQGILSCSILLTHTHWDHIQGLPFFAPCFIEGFKISIYGPARRSQDLSSILAGQMNYAYSPMRISDLKAKFEVHEMDEHRFKIGSYSILPKTLNHPVKTYGYKIQSESKTITTVFDHEVYRNVLKECDENIAKDIILSDKKISQNDLEVKSLNESIADFMNNSHLLIADSHFIKEEYYNGKTGWGHGPIEALLQTLKDKKVHYLALFHHSPEKNDEEIMNIYKYLKNFIKKQNIDLNLLLAEENLELRL